MRKIFLLVLVALGVVLWLTAANPTPTAASSRVSYYVVRYGDTLSSIAVRFGVSTWALARANGIWNPNYIYAGQVLYIPCSGCWYPYPIPRPVPGPVPGPIYRCLYQVRYGDTMISIAARLGTDAWTLARHNGIYNLNWIYAGQWLRVPGCRP